MKNTKREWMPLYGFLDRKRVTDHLADMAAKGWLLDHLSSWSWRYRRTEPKQLRPLANRRGMWYPSRATP